MMLRTLGYRGRPHSKISYKNRRILDYLARIAVMHKVNSSEFFRCLLEAWNHEESECNQLVIICRERTKNSAIFLFTNSRKVVAQFPISTTILNGIRNYYIRMRGDFTKIVEEALELAKQK